MLGSLQRKKILLAPEKSFFAKWIPARWHHSLFIFIFYSLLAAALLAPISSSTAIPNLGDYLVNLAAIIQAKIGLSMGQFPLRFMPLEHGGWHYPLYQFYSPTTYTFAGLIYEWLTPSNPLLAFKITVWTGLVLGGVYMERLAFWFVQSRPAAVLTGVIYLCAPYYIIIVNQLGSLNEIVALGILPAVIYYTLTRFYFPQVNSILMQAAIAWYLLLTTHIVTFVYASFFIGILLLLITYKNPRHWRNLFSVGSAYLFACLLGMWYLAPIAALEKFFVLSSTYNNAATISLFHPLLSQLLFPAAAITSGYKSNALMTIHPSVGWPILFSVALCVYAAFNKLSCGSRRADYWMPSLLVIFFIAFFMAWSPVNFWQWLPQPLLAAQHCWRLLAQVIWIGALLSAWSLCWLFKNKLDLRHIIIGTFLVMMSANAWFPVSEEANVELSDFIKNPRLIYNNDAYTINFGKYTRFVDKIDNTLIETGDSLKINNAYNIPKPLLQLAINPSVDMQSDIPASLADRHLHLAAFVNNKSVASKELNAGAFHWTINLSAAKNLYTDSSPLQVKFMLLDKNNQSIKTEIPVKEIFLTGFLHPAETLNVTQVQPYCLQKNSLINCRVPASAIVNFIELPTLYYPELLKISLNGKKVAYQSIMFEGNLVAGVIPEINTESKIQIEFRGLVWANITSWFAWGLVILILLETIKNKFLHLAPGGRG